MIKGILFDLDDTLVEFNEAEVHALYSISKILFEYIGNRSRSSLNKYIDFSRFLELVNNASKSLNILGIYDRPLWWKRVIEFVDKSVKVDFNFLCDLSKEYWNTIMSNSKLKNDAIIILKYLKGKGIKIGMVTNTDGVCGNKLERIRKLGLDKYFDFIGIGGENGLPIKPDPLIFTYVCNKLGLNNNECLMVGDDYFKDCVAALNAGLGALCICKGKKDSLCITEIKDVMNIFP